MKKLVPVITLLIVFVLCLLPELGFAQCPMCKGAAEQSLKEGSTHALGLNLGIFYLFLIPYLLISTIAYLVWKSNKQAKKSYI